MRYLRYATAVIVPVGPFYDKTDGVTPETSLTITNERITLVAETYDGNAPTLVLDNVTGATSGTSNDLNYITGQDNGMMQLELSASNTTRLGGMTLTITDAANHVPVQHDYCVLPQHVFDAMFVANAGLGEIMLSNAAITVTNQTTFTLAAGSADDDAYNGCMAIITDATTALQKTARVIDDYTGSTKTVVLNAAAGFTIATNDLITIVSKAGAELANLTTHGGTAAKTTLERLVIASTTTNEPAIKATGNGTAAGIQGIGGATGPGLLGTGGATSGAGIQGTGTAGNSAGIAAVGQGSASGLAATGGATGHGILATGGATSGDGLRATAATSGKGINAIGIGTTQPGILATGGATTSAGLSLIGGSTSGDGLLIATTSGHGISSTGAGTTKHGIHAVGGSTTSHGINALGGGVGHGILATSGSGATGDGIRATAASTNGNGLNLAGVGTGAGLLSTAGATGIGISAVGGSTSGSGFKGTGTAGNAVGIEAQGQGSADGLRATGGATGHGINGIGGATSGVGLRGVGSAGNSAGIAAVGQGSAAGLAATGGATGAGISATGGGTSGAGAVFAAAAGNSDGLTLTAAGTGLTMNSTSTMPVRLKKNTAFINFMVKMELAADGTPATGVSPTVQRAIDGGAFAALAVATVTEISAGWYKFNFAASDLNGDSIAVKITATGCKQRDFTIVTQVAG